MKPKVIAGFGELMLRLSPPGKSRLCQTLPGTLEATYGGGEANVCVGIALLGGQSRYLTALPDNPIARAAEMQLKSCNCDTSHILFTPTGRMGVYFTECGSNFRPSQVIYDREHAVISKLGPEAYDFEQMLQGVDHLHLTGITPALSKEAFESTLAIAQYAHSQGISVSVDLNFRKKLWNWQPGCSRNELAKCCMEQIVTFADIIIGNEEDAKDVFGIVSGASAIEAGELDLTGYEDTARQLAQHFPNAKYIAITLRESLSADHNNWGAMLYDTVSQQSFFAPLDHCGKYSPYEIRQIVDRIGGGDSFCAGLLHALFSEEFSTPEVAIKFAVAASALKHTISGDFNYINQKEVVSLMNGATSGRVQR